MVWCGKGPRGFNLLQLGVSSTTRAAMLTWLVMWIIVDVARGPTGSQVEWAPALHLVEFWNVRMEIDPSHGLLQLWVILEQLLISMHKRLQHLHTTQLIN